MKFSYFRIFLSAITLTLCLVVSGCININTQVKKNGTIIRQLSIVVPAKEAEYWRGLVHANLEGKWRVWIGHQKMDTVVLAKRTFPANQTPEGVATDFKSKFTWWPPITTYTYTEEIDFKQLITDPRKLDHLTALPLEYQLHMPGKVQSAKQINGPAPKLIEKTLAHWTWQTFPLNGTKIMAISKDWHKLLVVIYIFLFVGLALIGWKVTSFIRTFLFLLSGWLKRFRIRRKNKQ